MFSRSYVVFVVALSMLLAPYCSSFGVTPSLAGDEASGAESGKVRSTLNIPIEASTDELAAVLNQSLPAQLYRGTAGMKNLNADVKRNGPVAVSAADDYLYLTLPIAMSLGYGMFETRAVPLKLRFRITAAVSPDWRVHTEIRYLGVSDLFSGEVGVGPISLKPRRIAESLSRPLQKVLSDLADRKINELLPLKSEIAKVWNLAGKPVLLDRNFGAWLQVTPEEVALRPLYARDNRVRLNVGIGALAELVVGPEPAARPPRPLPDLKLTEKYDDSFRIALNTDLFYRDLRASLTPLVVGREFNSDGKGIVVKDMDLYGKGDKLVVRVETRGSLEGVFLLTGKPVFNRQTNAFSVDDVDFDINTKSTLLQSADRFLHGIFRYVVEEKLNAELTRQLEESRRMAGKALAQVRLRDHLVLKGDIHDLKFRDVVVGKEKISIQVYAEGTSTVLVQ